MWLAILAPDPLGVAPEKGITVGLVQAGGFDLQAVGGRGEQGGVGAEEEATRAPLVHEPADTVHVLRMVRVR